MPNTTFADSLADSKLLPEPIEVLQSRRIIMFLGSGVAVATYQGLSLLS